uniref:Helicase C-terminal domain-containing protein n=1 Tax=Panagrolaimus sp. PS1159 TaxID=55785 RepID=A0AC35F2R3_9BILA
MIRAATRFMRRNKSASILSKKCSTNKLCMQEFQRVPKDERLETLKAFLDSKMVEVNMDSTKLPRILIFVNSQCFCDELTKILQTFGFGVIGIRGNYAQNLRLEAFEGFRDKRYPIMVSTDLCAKGIDIKDVELVINYELPYYIDTYIYRVGRVGRIREGQCLSFVDPDLNKFIVPKILQVLQVANHPVSSNFDEIVEECQRIIDDPTDGFDVFFDESKVTAIQR